MSKKLFAMFVVVMVVLAAVAAVQPLHSLFVIKAVCTVGLAAVVATWVWLSSGKAGSKKALTLVLVAVLLLTLSAESCDGDGSGHNFDSSVVNGVNGVVATVQAPMPSIHMSPTGANAVTVLGGHDACSGDCQASGANGDVQTK